MFAHMLVCVVVFHVGSQMCLVIEHLAANVARNVFGLQVDNLNMSFEIGFQVKRPLAPNYLTGKPRGIMEPHVLLQYSVQLEATPYKSLKLVAGLAIPFKHA